jgi:hypothetical protein
MALYVASCESPAPLHDSSLSFGGGMLDMYRREEPRAPSGFRLD